MNTFRTHLLLRPILVLLALSLLTGCFVVKEQYRNRVVAGLGNSAWPVPSGVYSRTNVAKNETKKNVITIRRKLLRGQRIYTIDGKPGEFYAFYPRGRQIYIVEKYGGFEDWASAFSYAYIDPNSGAVGNFQNECGDLSKSFRGTWFGNEDATTCAIRSAEGDLSSLGIGGLVDMLDASMKAKGEIQFVYRLQREVTDALR